MSLIEKLPKEDIYLINEYVGAYGGGGDASVILHEWARQKECLYHTFGDKFIISKEIDITVPNSDLYASMGSAALDIRCALRGRLDETYTSRCRFINLFREDLLVENKWISDDYEFSFNGKKFLIRRGEKLLRFLNKVCKELNLTEEFEKFRLEHSMVLNQRKFKGELCLSIHPMDYMTMSDNACGWSSCMNWTEDEGGCYRAGTIEMMNSPIVAVAYVKSDKPYYPIGGEIEWTNKRWRQLVLIGDYYAVTNKGYPYQDKNLSTEVLNMVAQLYPEKSFCEVQECEYDNFMSIGGYSFHFESNGAMYNDFGRDCYHYAIVVPSENIVNSHKYITFNGAMTCTSCGSIFYPETDEERYIECPNCDNFTSYCEHCGRRYHSELEEGPYGEYICCDCMADTFEDEITGTLYYADEMRKLYVIDEDQSLEVFDAANIWSVPHYYVADHTIDNLKYYRPNVEKVKTYKYGTAHYAQIYYIYNWEDER